MPRDPKKIVFEDVELTEECPSEKRCDLDHVLADIPFSQWARDRGFLRHEIKKKSTEQDQNR
jgi:hypothetical protein